MTGIKLATVTPSDERPRDETAAVHVVTRGPLRGCVKLSTRHEKIIIKPDQLGRMIEAVFASLK